jgi:hypothetical protein
MNQRVCPPAGNQGAEGDGFNVNPTLPPSADSTAHSVFDLFAAFQHSREPEPDPDCGRCGGPSGAEGAWCDQCINECREHTRRLDSQAAGGAR